MSTPSSFADYDLPEDLLAGVAHAGFTVPTPIQHAALPALLAGRDVAGRARTGSGKTAAFGLGLLADLDRSTREVQALVLCPTRELALQVATALRTLAARLSDTRVLTACGGRPLHDQRKALRHGGHVLVGTPGRVDHLLRSGHFEPSGVRCVVLDEADRMLDMGFSEAVEAIMDRMPAHRRTWLFSATFPDGVTDLGQRVQTDPLFVDTPDDAEEGQIHQAAFRTTRDDRAGLVARLLAQERPERALVFVETRADCADLADHLCACGTRALALHGDLDQRERDEALIQLRNHSACVLVATDVAARGLDIPALPMVVVAELSPEPARHVHRIGRTGRAGEKGVAYSIVASARELARLQHIEAETGTTIPRSADPGGSEDLRGWQPPHQTLLLLAGRRDKLRKGDVVGALVRDCGVPADALGHIDLLDRSTAVAIEREHAAVAARRLQRTRVKGKKVRVRLLR